MKDNLRTLKEERAEIRKQLDENLHKISEEILTRLEKKEISADKLGIEIGDNIYGDKELIDILEFLSKYGDEKKIDLTTIQKKLAKAYFQKGLISYNIFSFEKEREALEKAMFFFRKSGNAEKVKQCKNEIDFTHVLGDVVTLYLQKTANKRKSI